MSQQGSGKRRFAEARWSALRVAAVYVTIGALWILFSDSALYQAVADPDAARTLEMLKGGFFVLATGLLIYLLITREGQVAERLRRARRESNRFVATLLRNVPGMAYRCANDREWTMEFMSEGVTHLTGYSAYDLVRNETFDPRVVDAFMTIVTEGGEIDRRQVLTLGRESRPARSSA